MLFLITFFLAHSIALKEKGKKMDKLQATFKDLRDQIFNAEAIQTSNVVFRMHYVFTVTGLVTASVLLSLGQVAFVNLSILLYSVCELC